VAGGYGILQTQAITTEMNATHIDGTPIEKTPSGGHSTEVLIPQSDKEGSTSKLEGSLTPVQQFRVDRKADFKRLQDGTMWQQIKQRQMDRLDRIEYYLAADDVFLAKLEKASLKDISLTEGLLVDKLHAIKGNTGQMIGVEQHKQLDELLPAIMSVLSQRGVKVEATERKIEVTTVENEHV